MFSPDFGDLVGIPFVDGGRDAAGCDCWGLTMMAFKRFGIALPDFRIACAASALISSAIEQGRRSPQWQQVAAPIKAPLLVVMKGIDPDMPRACTHLGTFVGQGRMLHTMEKRMSCLERIHHPFFNRKIAGFFKYVG